MSPIRRLASALSIAASAAALAAAALLLDRKSVV